MANVGEKYTRYELYFQYGIIDSFFPEYPPNIRYSTINEARKRALAEPDIKAYQIVKCDREIIESKKLRRRKSSKI